MTERDLRRALIRTDPSLSRFNPLGRILFFDDFDYGTNGWCELIGNYVMGDLDTVRPIMADFRPPQLSSCSFFDIGTHGSVDGTYALKLATRPRANHMATAIKRLTSSGLGPVQLEAYFTFKSEVVFAEDRGGGTTGWDGNVDPSLWDFGDFAVSNDICEGADGERYHCVLRYMNTDAEGNLVQKWLYKTSVQQTTKIQLQQGTTGPSDYHTQHPEDWQEVPGGHQPLCYNEVPTKINWHYLRWVFDTKTRSMVELQVGERTMDLRAVPVPRFDHSYENVENLLNFVLDVRTHRDVRNFLYLDSILVSADW